MRISCIREDRGFSLWERHLPASRHLFTMLDGEYVPHVLTADEEEGLVLRGASDEDGNVLRDGDVILTVELRGVVKIIIPTVPPPDREQ